MPVFFHEEHPSFSLKQKTKLKHWVTSVISEKGFKHGEINYIFYTDKQLLELNRSHLGHDTYTDIITFDLSEKKGVIAGDIFISIDRVMENATAYKEGFEHELRRVMIHGVLHLLGEKDMTKSQKEKMRSEENLALTKWDDSAS